MRRDDADDDEADDAENVAEDEAEDEAGDKSETDSGVPSGTVSPLASEFDVLPASGSGLLLVSGSGLLPLVLTISLGNRLTDGLGKGGADRAYVRDERGHAGQEVTEVQHNVQSDDTTTTSTTIGLFSFCSNLLI